MAEKLNGFIDVPNKPGFVKGQWEYNNDVKEFLKHLPGVTYNDKFWHVPKELVPRVCNYVKEKVNINLTIPDKKFATYNVLSKDFRPYQQAFSDLTANQHGGIAAMDPGLGKSLPAITLSAEHQTVVIPPPRNIMTWVREIKKWLPEARVYAHRPGKKWKYKGEQFLVIGNTMLTKAMKENLLPDYFKRVIIDELQHFTNYKSARTEALATLLAAHPEAMRIGLSGLLAPNRLHQIYQPIHCFWPFRFGTPSKFQDRYCRIEFAHGFRQIRGTSKDPDIIEELRERFAGLATLASKKEWAHLLPALNFSFVVCDKPEEYKKEEVDSNQERNFESHFYNVRLSKVAPSVDIALGFINEGVERICIGAWHKDVAHAIYDTLKHDKEVIDAGHTLLYVDGETHSSFDRESVIAKFIEQNPLAILVCTQASTKEGMNALVAFDHVIPAEIYWRPDVLIQWCGRFHRLNSVNSVTIKAPYCKGTKDEQIIAVVDEKMRELSGVLGQDATGSMFTQAIDGMREKAVEELYHKFSSTVYEGEEDDVL